ncbi:hypothetical protein BDA99DRAFT_423723, partial [Phascolomyces articulosus]
LYICNLDEAVTMSDLWKECTKSGSVTQVNIITDKRTGISKVFGFVKYNSNETAANAVIYMNGQQLLSKQIHVEFAYQHELQKKT